MTDPVFVDDIADDVNHVLRILGFDPANRNWTGANKEDIYKFILYINRQIEGLNLD